MKVLKHMVALGGLTFALCSLIGFGIAALSGDLDRPKIRAELSCDQNAAFEEHSLRMREQRELTLRVSDMRIDGEPDYKVKYFVAKRMAEIDMDAEERHDKILRLCRDARGEE